MPGWDEIARENLKAAQLLAARCYFRSCASRAYYAAFSAVSFALRTHGPFEFGRETPAHQRIATLIQEHLGSRLSSVKLRDVKSTIRRLYNERINADYRSGITLNRSAAMQSQRDAHAICRAMGVGL